MARPDETAQRPDPADAARERPAPEDETFEHQIKRFVAEREARRAARPGVYR